MPTILKQLDIAQRALTNYASGRPLCVSFEVTYRCNARCQHCHLRDEQDPNPAPPRRFGELCRELRPTVAQISGGEPLLRPDLLEIVRELKTGHGAPMVVLTTNARLLTLERYYALRHLGVDEFSISLDYPDARHDAFRGLPGLFDRITGLLEAVRGERDKAITLACVVQRHNFRDLLALAELARKHGVKMSFSTYTWLRTQDRSFMVPPEELPELRGILDELLPFQKRHGTVFTTAYVFERMIRFFETGGISGCRAGERFLVVNPSGTLAPCGLIAGAYRSQQELIEGFSRTNTCTACNTSIRANTEKPLGTLVRDALGIR